MQFWWIKLLFKPTFLENPGFFVFLPNFTFSRVFVRHALNIRSLYTWFPGISGRFEPFWSVFEKKKQFSGAIPEFRDTLVQKSTRWHCRHHPSIARPKIHRPQMSMGGTHVTLSWCSLSSSLLFHLLRGRIDFLLDRESININGFITTTLFSFRNLYSVIGQLSQFSLLLEILLTPSP